MELQFFFVIAASVFPFSVIATEEWTVSATEDWKLSPKKCFYTDTWRFDCIPQPQDMITEAECLKRGCCW